MASTLFIQLPSKSVAHSAPDWSAWARPFALVSGEGNIQQQGIRSWSELTDFIRNAHRVVLILSASDVSLLQAKVPPMSAAKLKVALPHVLEEQLVGDLSELLLLSSPVTDGICTVAVTDRAWLENVHALVKKLGAARISAYPAQMLAPHIPGTASIMVEPSHQNSHLASLLVRSSHLEGFGLSLNADSDQELISEVVNAAVLLVPEIEIALYVPDDQLAAYQEQVALSAHAVRVQVSALTWNVRIAGLAAGVSDSSFDLMRVLDSGSNSAVDWRTWRWPIGLAAAVLLVNVVGLNVEWVGAKKEADRLSQSLARTYRSSFPQDTVILDPLVQMRQKILLSKKMAGEASADDFVVLASHLSSVLDTLSGSRSSGVASIDYRERSLFVKPKTTNAIPVDALRTALQGKSLSLITSTDGTLQVKPSLGADKK